MASGVQRLKLARRERARRRGKPKVRVVMREFKRRTLKSSSGRRVTNPKQAIAIALSEAGLSRKRKK